MLRLVSLLALLSTSGFGQFISVGVKGGVPLTDAYSTVSSGLLSATAYNRRYVVGPTAELHLPFHLSFEVDALYRRNGFDYSAPPSQFFTGFSSRTKVNDWEIPLLGKYTLGAGPFRPFLDAGLTYRHVSIADFIGISGATKATTPFVPLDNPSIAGFTLGGGLTLKLLLIRVSPEIRYTHWGSQAFQGLTRTSTTPLSSTTDQADFLVGLTF